MKRNACDLYCCCDSDCSSDLVNDWNDVNDYKCLVTDTSYVFCVKKSAYYKVNLRRGMILYSQSDDSLICIQGASGEQYSKFITEFSDLSQADVEIAKEDAEISFSSYDDLIRELYSSSSSSSSSEAIASSSENATEEEEEIATALLRNLQDSSSSESAEQDDAVEASSSSEGENEEELYIPAGKGSSSYNVTLPFLDEASRLCENELIVFEETTEEFKCLRYSSLNSLCKSGSSLDLVEYSEIDFVTLKSEASIPINLEVADGSGTTSSKSPSKTEGSNSCTCSNYLKRLRIQFVVESNDITAIYIEALLGNYKADSCTEAVFIQQEFFYEFLTVDESLDNSGNPGYLWSYPLIKGFEYVSSSSGSAINRPVGRFRVVVGDEDGNCMKNSENDILGELQSVNFGQELELTCEVDHSQESVASMCSESYYESLRVFSVFNSSVYLAKVGDPNNLWISDWTSIVQAERSEIALGDSNCSFPTTQTVLVFYKDLHIPDYPQYYVMGAYSFTSGSISLTDGRTSTSMKLDVKFVNLETNDIENSEQGTPPPYPELPPDFFIPLFMDLEDVYS